MIELLVALFVGLALGGVSIWFLRAQTLAPLQTQLRERDAQIGVLQAELLTLRSSEQALRTELAKEQATAAERMKALHEAHERLTHEFKALSADALSRNNQSFLDLAKQTFAQLQTASAGDLDKRQIAIASLVQPLRESLAKVDAKIGEIEQARASAYGKLGQQLESLNHAQLLLQAEAGKLSNALRSTTTAGTWGELQLRRVVELAGMTAYCDFSEQETVGSLRPDMVVRLPGGQHIVIDAKAPNEAYREAANAADDKVRTSKLAEHAAKVRGHIDALGAKAYWEQFQPSPEFVVLFLPGDQFLAGALEAEPSLIDRAIGKKVLLATPATLIALLKATAYGWRQEAVSQNAEEISKLGRELYDRISTFSDHLQKVGRGLEIATKSYNSAVGSFESSILPSARRFEDLGAKGNKALEAATANDLAPRDVTKRS